jgi:hypothetical protein
MARQFSGHAAGVAPVQFARDLAFDQFLATPD